MTQSMSAQVIGEHTHDAVVIVPGIMGSVLKDADVTIWGFQDPRDYLRLWTGSGMSRLGLNEAEVAAIVEGTYDPDAARVRPSGLIKMPAYAPFLRGLEPYTQLVRRVKSTVAHPDAVLEFSYDWRLPTVLNSRLLARAMKAHLKKWHAHEAHAAARRIHPEQRDAGIVIVAHSMGGLVVRGLGDKRVEEGFANVRQVITLGTPFYGSINAAVMLKKGEGGPVPLPHGLLREAVRTMPGVFDLLPRNRCLLTTLNGNDEVVALSVDDVVSVGACRALAEASARDFDAVKTVSLPGHRPIVGTAQPTWGSLQITNETVVPSGFSYRWYQADGELIRDHIGRPIAHDDQGDGTVPRYSARPQGAPAPTQIAQQHGALATSNEAIRLVTNILTDRGDLGPRLGDGGIGLVVPDVVQVGQALTITVTGESDPARVSCQVCQAWDSGNNEDGQQPRLSGDGPGRLTATIQLRREGIYRVQVKSGGAEPVTQLVMVTGREP